MKRALIMSYIIVTALLILPNFALAGTATISWNPNTDVDLAGYKVYYGTTKGGPYGSSTALISKTMADYTFSNLSPGTYYFVVVAVDTADNESAYSVEASKTISAITSPATAVTLTPSVSSPQTAGATVTFTAQASGGSGTYEYQFWRTPPEGASTLVRDYSSINTFAWNTTGATGANQIQVRTRVAGTTVAYDVTKSLDYNVASSKSPATAITFTSSASSPQTVGKTITFTAQASGGSGPYEYQFWRKTPGGEWSVTQNYSSKNTFAWNTTGATGTNAIWVWARSAGTTVERDVDKGIYYVIKIAPTAVTLKADVASPQKANKKVTFTAQASGGSGTYEYQFWKKPSGGSWSIVQNYSSKNTYSWVTANPAGKTQITVWVRNAGTSNNYDGYKSVWYEIK